MLSLHYSGNIVKHPDTAAAYVERMNRYVEQGRCRYGFIVSQCEDWKKERYKIRAAGKLSVWPGETVKDRGNKFKINDADQCKLGQCGLCPRYRAQVEHGKSEKSFKITNRHYQQIADRTAWLKDHSDNKLIFVTLTFPPYKNLKDYENRKKFERKHNECFSKFIENLRKTYKCSGYIAIREGDGINKRYHFHLIAAMPFVDFRRLNTAWCCAISDFCENSANAFTSDKKSRTVYSTTGAVRYICKYISKARYEPSQTRIIFTDRITAQALITTNLDECIEEIKEQYDFRGYILNDFCIKYSIPGTKELDNFIKNVVRALIRCRELPSPNESDYKKLNKNIVTLSHFAGEEIGNYSI